MCLLVPFFRHAFICTSCFKETTKTKNFHTIVFTKQKRHFKDSILSSGYDRAYHVLFEKHLENITSIEDGPNR